MSAATISKFIRSFIPILMAPAQQAMCTVTRSLRRDIAMTECNNRLATLLGRLRRSLSGRPGIDIKLLPEAQMQISRNLIPNPDFGTRGKTYSNVPDKDGYRIYIACHTQVEYAAVTGTSQRLL